MSFVVSPILMVLIVSESGGGLVATLLSEIEDKLASDRVRFLSSDFQSRSFSVVILIGLDLFWRKIGVEKSFVSWIRPFLIRVICGGGH